MLISLRHRAKTSAAIILAVLATMILPVAPAYATWGGQIPVEVSVSGGGLLRGSVHGWVQFDDGRTAYRYELTFCRRSSFVAPRLNIWVNGALRNTRFHGDQGQTPSPICPFAVLLTEEVNFGSPVQKVQFIIIGSSFDNNVFREHASAIPPASRGTFVNPFF